MTTNPERLTPQTTGIYQFMAQVDFAINSTGHRAVVIQDSSATFIGSQVVDASTTAGIAGRVQAVGLKRFDVVGGYASVFVGLSGASTMSLSTGTGLTWFSMQKL